MRTFTCHASHCRWAGGWFLLSKANTQTTFPSAGIAVVFLCLITLCGCVPLKRPSMFPPATAQRQTVQAQVPFEVCSKQCRCAQVDCRECEQVAACDSLKMCPTAEPSTERKLAYFVMEEMCLTAKAIRAQEIHWQSAAEAYGDTAQLSRRLRDVLAVGSVATAIHGLGKTSVYYGLAAVVADRFPDLVGAERQQAVYLLSADTASCLHAAIQGASLSVPSVELHLKQIEEVRIARTRLMWTTREIADIQANRAYCRTISGDSYTATNSGEHLRFITSPHKKASSICGPNPSLYLDDYRNLDDRAERQIVRFSGLLASMKKYSSDLSRLIDKTTYAVNLELARGDATNLSGLQLAQTLIGQVNGTAQSGGDPTLPALQKNTNYALAKQQLSAAIMNLTASNEQLAQQIDLARREVEACPGMGSAQRLNVSPNDSVINLYRENPAIVLRADDSAGAPVYSLTGRDAQAFAVDARSDGNSLTLTVSGKKDLPKGNSSFVAILTFESRDGKRRAQPIQLQYKP